MGTPEIACRKDEHSGIADSERRDFQRAISQSLILCEDNPAPLADRLEPDAILFITNEMVVVNLDNEPGIDEFCSDSVLRLGTCR